jgi:hypothetical protein
MHRHENGREKYGMELDNHAGILSAAAAARFNSLLEYGAKGIGARLADSTAGSRPTRRSLEWPSTARHFRRVESEERPTIRS